MRVIRTPDDRALLLPEAGLVEAVSRLTAGLGPEGLQRVAGGEASLDPSRPRQVAVVPSITDVWDAADLDARLATLQETESSIKRLSLVPERLARVEGVRARMGLSQTDISRLQDRVALAAIQLEVQASHLANLRSALRDRTASIGFLVDRVRDVAEETIRIYGTTAGSFQTRAGMYIGADIGLSYAWQIGEIVPYFGFNVYFRPVNKDAPLSIADSFWHRFAVLLGLTLGSVAKDAEREDLFGSSALVAGFGFRVTDSIRLAGGCFLYKKLTEDPATMEVDEKLEPTPFVSASIDWDVRSFVERLFKGMGANI